MHKYIIVRVFSHKTKEMTLSPMTETKSPNSALECFPKFSQKCRACVKSSWWDENLFLLNIWYFMSISLFCLQGAILSMNFHWKKGTCYVKYSRGVGCLPTWAFYTVLTFFLNGKKNKQTKHYERKKFVWQGRMNSSTCSRHFSPQSRLFLVPAKMYPYVDPLIDL